jgi:ribosomal protein L37E
MNNHAFTITPQDGPRVDDQKETLMQAMANLCRRCGWRPIRATKTLCTTCWDYQHRTGQPRPERIIMRHLNRTIEKQHRRVV